MGATGADDPAMQRWAAALVLTVLLCGCSGSERAGSQPRKGHGTITGSFSSTFVHGDPFYGSPVFLIRNDANGQAWWSSLARHSLPLVYPEIESSLIVVGRTTCEASGSVAFRFENVPVGHYIVYSRVFWADASSDSTVLRGDGWGSFATVAAAGDSVRVILAPSNYANRRSGRSTRGTTFWPDPAPTSSDSRVLDVR